LNQRFGEIPPPQASIVRGSFSGHRFHAELLRGVTMNMRNSFNYFTPGMKAKLDPTYRRKTKLSEPPGMFNMVHERSKFARPSLLPFTSNHKVNRVTDRLI
jgi:hypothetical protein